jgi:capsular exopolysaccharide synthesis family protein
MEAYQLDIRAFLDLLRRRLWLIAAVVVVIVGGATLVTLLLPPAFTATALVLVDGSRKDLLASGAKAETAATDSARIDSEVELARSDATMTRIVADPRLAGFVDFAYEPDWRTRLLTALRLQPTLPPTEDEVRRVRLRHLAEALRIDRRGTTYVIAVSARATTPDGAALLANVAADVYVRAQLDAKVDSALTARAIVQDRLPDAKKAVIDSHKAMIDFYVSRIAPIAMGSTDAALVDLARQLTATARQDQQLQSLADALAAASAKADWDSVLAAAGQSPGINGAVLVRLDAQRRQTEQSLVLTADESTQQNLRHELDRITAELAQNTATAVATLRRQAGDAATHSAEVIDAINPELKNINLPADLAASMYAMLANESNATSNYNALIARDNDLAVGASLQLADSRVMSKAMPPTEPSFPDRRMTLLLALPLALGLGIILAFLYENYIGGFTSEEQLAAVLGLPVATAVPALRAPRGADGSPLPSLDDVLLASPLSVFAETVRRIRVRIGISARDLKISEPLAGERGTVVMISSAAPGEGKTTLALALARACAVSGRQTLLIDCDLRKPSVHEHLGLPSSTGLVDYLSGHADARELGSFTVTDPQSAAQVAIGGRRSDTATDQLVANHTFARLIDSAVRVFDMVILDTPPVGPAVDGIYLSQYADAIVFVVEARRTSQQDVKKAAAAIARGKRGAVEMLLVLNRYEDPSSAHYQNHRAYHAG